MFRRIISVCRIQQERREVCHVSLERSREVREKRALMYTRLKPLTSSKRHTPSHSNTTGSSSDGRSRRVRAEALATREGIDKFEAGLGLSVAMESRPHSTGGIAATQSKDPSSDYVAQIRKRVQDNEHARKVSVVHALICLYKSQPF